MEAHCAAAARCRQASAQTLGLPHFMSRLATVGADVDEQGWPKAPIEVEEPLTEEQILRQERIRDEILAEHAPAEPQLVEPVKVVPLKSHMSQEDFDELGYPKVPKTWDENYFSELMFKERVDPRENPNLLIDEGHREFWNVMARKPFAKAILRSEQHWTDRRNVWLKQYENVELMNQSREVAANLLEECSMEVKRLLTPIMQHKITQISLQIYLREARERKIPLRQCLQNACSSGELQVLRSAIDAGGDAGAARMLEEYTALSQREQAEEQKKKDEEKRGKRVLTDYETVASQLNQAQSFRKDGYIEWHKGNVKEALAAWRAASKHLRKHKLPDDDAEGNRMIAEVQIALLKNVAQAAIRLGSFTEALTAADDALKIDDQDHKAWFRRACALEGLGRYEEEEKALKVIEDIAVGRTDRDRILKDIGQRREKVLCLLEKDKEAQKRCVTLALESGVFRGQRFEKAAPRPVAPAMPKPSTEDCPGNYSITQTAAVKAGQALSSRKIRDLRPGAEVKVLEVVLEGRTEPRVRARIEEPAGWITLKTPDGRRYAEKLKGKDWIRGLRLTKDGAAELLDELRRAYGDTALQQQISKLAVDMRGDAEEFKMHLKRVALAAQKPVLERWGFAATLEGAAEMERALLEHTKGEARDLVLSEQLEDLRRLLHGEMYELVFPRSGLGPAPPPATEGLREEVLYTIDDELH